jgi:hypothetical protein
MSYEKKSYPINLSRLEDAIERFSLTTEQEDVIEKLLGWHSNYHGWEASKEPAILDAFGGSGKTYLLVYLILKLIQQQYYAGKVSYTAHFKIVLLAPSNQAVEELRRAVDRIDLWRFCDMLITTIHAFSGIALGDLDEEAKRIENWVTKEDDAAYNLVAVDEYGMIDDDLFNSRLRNFAANAPILYIGNLEQLPPVKSIRPPGQSPISEAYPNYRYYLNKVMRFKSGSGIHAYCNQLLTQYVYSGLQHSGLVKNLILDIGTFEKQCDRAGYLHGNRVGQVHLPLQRSADCEILMRHELIDKIKELGCLENVLKDPTDFRILTYTNAAVTDWNKIVRSVMHGDINIPPQPGEPMLVKAPIYELVDGKPRKAFFTNQLLRLEDVQSVQSRIFDPADEAGVRGLITFPQNAYPFYRLTCVNRYNKDKDFLYPTGKTLSTLISVMMQWWSIIWNVEDPRVRAEAFNTWDRTLNYFGLMYTGNAKKKQLEKNLIRRLILFAYSGTIHSAQGMSLNNSFVDMADINKAPSIDTKLRLTYVGFSRAKNYAAGCLTERGGEM